MQVGSEESSGQRSSKCGSCTGSSSSIPWALLEPDARGERGERGEQQAGLKSTPGDSDAVKSENYGPALINASWGSGGGVENVNTVPGSATHRGQLTWFLVTWLIHF